MGGFSVPSQEVGSMSEVYERICADNIKAIKARDQQAKSAYGLLISKAKYLISDLKAQGKELTDADVYTIVAKSLKELDEEYHTYADNGRPEQAAEIKAQIEVVKKYAPAQMDENEIRAVIKALPAEFGVKEIMQKFKTEYAGRADMRLVAKIAKEPR